MEPVHIIAFPIQRVANSFNFGTNLSPCLVNWANKTPRNLSEALNCQINNNWIDYLQLQVICASPEDLERTLNNARDIDNQQELLKNYYLSSEQKAEQCAKFYERLSG